MSMISLSTYFVNRVYKYFTNLLRPYFQNFKNILDNLQYVIWFCEMKIAGSEIRVS